MIKRDLVNTIIKHAKSGFITIIYGPRRVGKTVILDQLRLETNLPEAKVLIFNGDTQETRDMLSNTSEVALSRVVDGKKLIIIDEAQRITNIGLSL